MWHNLTEDEKDRVFLKHLDIFFGETRPPAEYPGERTICGEALDQLDYGRWMLERTRFLRDRFVNPNLTYWEPVIRVSDSSTQT
jgi:hypothetical protein